jgi:hypothetical protein
MRLHEPYPYPQGPPVCVSFTVRVAAVPGAESSAGSVRSLFNERLEPSFNMNQLLA